MPTLQEESQANSLSLLPTVLKQLPEVLNNTELASSVFAALRKASRSHRSLPFISPLLPPITSAVLTAGCDSLRGNAALTCVALVRALIARGLSDLAAAYVRDLVAAARRIIEHDNSAPLTFLLPEFINAARRASTSEQETSALNAMKIPPVPVSPKSLELLLCLLAAFIPSSLPFSFVKDALGESQALSAQNADDIFPSLSPASIRLWVCLSVSARTSVLNLASRHVLLSGRCGTKVALAAANVLERAFDIASGCVVPPGICERLSAVINVILTEMSGSSCSQSSENELRAALYRLSITSSPTDRMSSTLWTAYGIHDATTDDGAVGNLLRSFSSCGFASYEAPCAKGGYSSRDHNSSPSPAQPRKRRRVEDSVADRQGNESISSQQLSISQDAAVSREDAMRNPVAALKWELQSLENIPTILEDQKLIRMLARVANLTGDAISRLMKEDGLKPETLEEWLSFASSFALIIRDVFGNVRVDVDREVWEALLFVAAQSMNLARSLLGVKQTPHPNEEVDVIVATASLARDSCILIESVGSLLQIASSALDSTLGVIPLQALSVSLEQARSVLQNAEISSSAKESLSKTCSSVMGYTLAFNQETEDRSLLGPLLRASVHLFALLRPPDAVREANEIICKPFKLFKKNIIECPPLAAAALYALSDLICLSVSCFTTHLDPTSSGECEVEFSQTIDEDTFIDFSDNVFQVLKGTGDEELLAAAAHCCGVLVFHAPDMKIGEATSVLIQTAWHPTCALAREKAFSFVSSLLVFRTSQLRREAIAGSPSTSAPRCGSEDSWDDLDTSFIPRGDSNDMTRLLGVELKQRTQSLGVARHENTATKALKLQDVIPLTDILLHVPLVDSLSAKVAGLAAASLLAPAVDELQHWKANVQRFSSTGEELNVDVSRVNAMFTAWGSFLSCVSSLEDHHSEERRLSTGSNVGPGGASVLMIPPDIARRRLPLGTAAANFLHSRMKEWLPFIFGKMLRSDIFAAQLADTLGLQDVETLWKKVPRYVMGILLRTRNSEGLASLSSRSGQPAKYLVERTCADALARAAMLQRVGLDLSSHGLNSLISQSLQQPLKDIISSRAGKIVQRIVMELGGVKDRRARNALIALAQVLGIGESRGLRKNVAGMLVATHFMLVMDAVNRGLFHSKATQKERMNYLRMLGSVLDVTCDYLHLYVPKILATLKMALDSDRGSATFQAETLNVWAGFLKALGAQRLLPHLCSVLSILIPFVQRYDALLSSTLITVIEEARTQTFEAWPEVTLLLRISNNPTLVQSAKALEDQMKVESSRNARQSVSPGTPSCQEDRSSSLEMNDLLTTCDNVSRIVARQENAVIEAMSIDHLLSLLRSNRERVDRILSESRNRHDCVDSKRPEVLVKLLEILISSFNKSCAEKCKEKIMQCIGEIGAIDPTIISRFAEVVPHERMLHRTQTCHAYPRRIHALAALLLDDYLVPALGRGEERGTSSNHLNRIGLVIQELLRVCGCSQDTAVRASHAVGKTKESKVDWDSVLVGETPAENAIYFWEHLELGTRTAAQPYLAEPFDVQHYKGVFGGNAAGDVQLACQPVWSKVKAAAPPGTTPAAREWRRQVIVQLVDFIGKQGRFGATLRALRPVLRYDDDVTTYVFPLVITTALDIQKTKQSIEVQDFLSNEIAAVLREGASPQPIFELFDILRLWREERCKTRGRLVATGSYGSGSAQSTGWAKGRPALAANIERERVTDSLTPLIDLNGHESSSLSLLLQAKAAFFARSFARAIMFAEYFVRNLRAKRGFVKWPSYVDQLHGNEGKQGSPYAVREQEALGILQKAFAELEDAKSMTGIAILRASSSLSDSVVDAEIAGRYDEALVTYERALAEQPRSVKLHSGFLRCLMTLGHWETMLSHAEGLVSSAKMEELGLRQSAQAHGINAAWRLGRWEKVRDFGALSVDTYHESHDQIETSWELDFNVSFGKMLLALRQRNVPMLTESATQARKNLIQPLAHLSREGYGRAYPVVALLHCVAEAEDCAELIRHESKSEPGKENERSSSHQHRPLVICSGRSDSAAASLRMREPLLSTRRACLELLNRKGEAAKVNLQLSVMAQEGGNLRAASACAFSASKIDTSDHAIKNATVMQMARIRHAQGDAAGALLMVKKEIDRLVAERESGAWRDRSASESREYLTRACTALVLAGRWVEESRSESSEVIQRYYEQAAAYGPSREEPFYALGRHFDTLLQAATSETKSSQGSDGSGARSSRRSIGSASGGSNLLQYSHYVPQIIRSFSKVLCNGHSRVYDALPRMLTVWFDYHSAADCVDSHLSGSPVEGDIKREMKKAFDSIPSYMWMTAVPQIMSRLLHPRKVVRDDLMSLLARAVYQYPDQSAWLITPSNQLKSTERKKATNTILSMAVGIAKKGRRAESDMDKQAQNHKLKGKIQRSICVLKELVQICLLTVPKEKRNREENFAQEFRRLKDTLRSSSAVNPMVPTLDSLTVRMPVGRTEDHRPFDEEPIYITDVHDYAYVMASLMRPRRITLLGSDGRRYRYLAKKETSGDMRKDSRLVEFITVVNRLLSKDTLSQQREITLKTYAVLPLTEESGMIEWVDNLEPLRKLVREQHTRMADMPDMATIQTKYQKTRDKLKFHEWAISKFPPVLDKFFLEAFGAWSDPQVWLNSRNLWTQSVAVWSMAGYVVGLGDRHGENILIEATTGRCVHVDFAMLFDKGANLKVPEIVPFRLTPNMVTAMGIAGYEGLYRTVAETVMGILRKNSDALLGVLETFLYDPLVDWGKSDTRIANGNIAVVTSKEAWQTRAAVKAKLTGMMDESGLALSINGQVQRLILEATSNENLSRMYLWWSGWL